MTKLDEVAMAIYWVGYEARGARHWPHNEMPQTPERAWEKAGDVQRDYCREQARAAARVLGIDI